MLNKIFIVLIVSLISNVVLAENTQGLHKYINGKWKGAWDGHYGMELEITSDGDKAYNIVYRVEEYKGKEYIEKHILGKYFNKNTIVFGPIFVRIYEENPNKAVAIGIFDTQTRIAELKREK